ncbi:hypothetical protein D3C87_2123180 [compost metagenome]
MHVHTKEAVPDRICKLQQTAGPDRIVQDGHLPIRQPVGHHTPHQAGDHIRGEELRKMALTRRVQLAHVRDFFGLRAEAHNSP